MLAVALPPDAWPLFRMRLEQSAAASPPLASLISDAALGSAAVLGSALLDKGVDKFVVKHEQSSLMRNYGKFGKNMPLVLVGGVGAALAFGDERMQNTGIIALQSVAGALGVTAVGKYALGRARPDQDRGPWSQVGEGQSRSNSSFPSGHTAVAFAAVTPFAKEYNAPWLYGLAAISGMGRTANRQHWTSDVVAGGLAGYAMGSWLWQGQHDQSRSKLTVIPAPKAISVAWQTTY